MFFIRKKPRGKLIAGLAAALLAVQAHAITINMEYTDEGSTPPHPENPTWDPAGVILKAHFQRAKEIWESLLPGGGTYSFDFHWDDNIDGLALTTLGAADNFIEIHPTPSASGVPVRWFADPTLDDDNEFNLVGAQRLYSGLSASDQSTYFPGTVPPGSLEVGFLAPGIANGTIVNGMPLNTLSATGENLPGTMTPVDANNGYDLLSSILHEIGHVLGIGGVEPGFYNIDPQHVGGLLDVTVLDNDAGGGHLGGGPVTPGSTNIVPGFLMCEGCGVQGLRRFASATDVLVIAEEEGITVVQLARVGRISSGNWSDTNGWIGGDVPDGTQDVYITHGGIVTVDVGASANNVLVAPGNGLAIQTGQSILVDETLTFTGGTLTVGPGGSIFANALVGDPSSISSAAGSLVRFNTLTETTATSASFGGSVAIGFDTDFSNLVSPFSTTVNPSSATWTIAENLIIGDENFANLIVDNGDWTVNGNVTLGEVLTDLNGGWRGGVTLQNTGVMTVGGNLDIPLGDITVEDGAELNVTGNITIGRQSSITYRDNRAAVNRPYFVAGGKMVPVPGQPPFIQIAGGSLVFEDTANAADATVTLEGGAGFDAVGGLVVFKGNSSAGNSTPGDPALPRAEFRTKGGRLGPGPSVGSGGQVRFEGTSSANNAMLINEGEAESAGGTGGRTIFLNNATADRSQIDNYGPAIVNGDAGATHFFNNSTAGSATITNHATGTTTTGAVNSRGRTVFFDTSDAGNATIENEGAPYNPGGSTPPGMTEFRNNSSAAFSNIYNRAVLTTSGLGAGLAGRTVFYDSATAADATIHTYEGASDHGRVEFRDNSKAGRARIIMENVPAATSNGGYVNFFDNSSAEQAQIFVRAGVCCVGGISFNHNATAADAQILTEDFASTFSISFLGNSTAGDPPSAPTAAKALFTLGRGSVMSFYDQTKAEDAGVTLAHGAQLHFNGNSSAGSATIVAAGSSVFGIEGAAITFNTSSLVNNATITLGGGMASQATGAKVLFNNGSHAGNSTITANGGSNGGGGATITFSNSYGDTAQIIANAGSTVDFVIQPTFNNGTTTLGSIEGAGKFVLRGSHLITGTRNTSTTVSGPITDNPNNNPFYSGGRLTKVGTGTLTLAGTNNYSGLTTVNDGGLSVTGSLSGGATVNSGATFGGTGSVGGLVTVESGAHVAPGTSVGTITMAGGLTTNMGSIFDFELGAPSNGDKINVTLANGLTLIGGTVNLTNAGGLGAGTYTLIDYAGTLGGAVGNLALGTQPAGFSYSLVNNAGSTSIDLMVSPAGVPGDYNNDGMVDAADYVLWRKGGPLANEVDNPGTVNGQDYTEWRSRFGNSGSGSGSGGIGDAAVPEPTTLTPLIVAAFGMWLLRGRDAL